MVKRPQANVNLLVSVAVAAALVLVGCTSSATPSATPGLSTPSATPVATSTPEPAATPSPTPEPTITPEPTATAVAALPPPRAIGDLAAAAPGTYVTAKPGAGFPLENGAFIVPVYDVPGGQPRALVDRNQIDNVTLTFPLRNPTVLRQPLVLRVIAGDPTDEWLLVQAPVRPHRQHVWVRAADFTFGQSSLRIEVDIRNGRFALFDGEREIISNPVVWGRETRPTIPHDTYVEQALEGFNPAYGTYILTLASYSETLGTYGGGGMPGQSFHGTNQPELMGQRVSSGGIRVPNEIIDFVYAQPGIIGASVIIYDSSGIGREAAIARQRNKPWTPAETVALDETNLPAVPVASYS